MLPGVATDPRLRSPAPVQGKSVFHSMSVRPIALGLDGRRVRLKWNSVSRSVVDQIQIAGVGWSLDPVGTSVDYLRGRFPSEDLGLSWRVLLRVSTPFCTVKHFSRFC